MMIKCLKPLDEAPDADVHTVAILASLACCPGMAPIGGGAEPDDLQKLEVALVEHAAKTDSDAYVDVHDKIPPSSRNTLLLLLWLLYQVPKQVDVEAAVSSYLREGARFIFFDLNGFINEQGYRPT